MATRARESISQFIVTGAPVRPVPAPQRARRRERQSRYRRWLLRALSGGPTLAAARACIHRSESFGFEEAGVDTLPAAPTRAVVAGAIHAHTTYSDGDGSVPEVARAAREAGMQFLVLSDHETLQPLQDGWQGRHEGVQVLVGAEIRTDGGYLLALGLPPDFHVPDRRLGPLLAAVRGAGGLAFAVHPGHPYLGWGDSLPAGLTGIEVMNLHGLSCRAASLAAVPGVLACLAAGRADQALRALTVRPTRELAMWDALLARGRVAGLAAADAHGHVRVGRLSLRLPDYAQSFRLVQTHLVLNATLDGDPAADRPRILAALRDGRCRLVYGANGDPAGFRFFHAGAILATEGEEAEWTPESRLCVHSPHPRTLLRLYRDGRLVAAGEGTMLTYPCPGPGTYRLEADRYGRRTGSVRWQVRPWVFTNPIYLR